MQTHTQTQKMVQVEAKLMENGVMLPRPFAPKGIPRFRTFLSATTSATGVQILGT